MAAAQSTGFFSNLISSVTGAGQTITEAKPTVDRALDQYNKAAPTIDFVLDNKIPLTIIFIAVIFSASYFGAAYGSKRKQ